MTEEAGSGSGGERRRNGSTLVGLIAAAVLFVLAVYLAGVGLSWWALPPDLVHLRPLASELFFDAICCGVFSCVLFWWSASGPAGIKMFLADRDWRIGNPTVSMVITVVAAVVAIITFSHELLRREGPPACQSAYRSIVDGAE